MNSLSRLAGLGFVILSAVGLTLSQASVASACDRGFCGSFGFALPLDGAQLPANAPALLWTPIANRGEFSPTELNLMRVDGGEVVEVDVSLEVFDAPLAQRFFDHLAVLPATALVEGGTYLLETPSTVGCGEDEVPVAPTFRVGPPAELPASLGSICFEALGEADLRLAQDASCFHDQQTIYADVGLVLDEAAEPWADLLVFETIVNGELWLPADISGEIYQTGGSWVGRGVDRVFAICNERPYSEHSFLLPGAHELSFRATVPGSDLVLETPPVRLEIVCGDLEASAISAPRCGGAPVAEPDPDSEVEPDCDEDPQPMGCQEMETALSCAEGSLDPVCVAPKQEEGCSVAAHGGQRAPLGRLTFALGLLCAVLTLGRRRAR